MVQLRVKAVGDLCGVGVTEEPSPAWLPAPTAASCSAPALRAPWPNMTVPPPTAESSMWQVRPLCSALPQPATFPLSSSCAGGVCLVSADRVNCLLWSHYLDPPGKCGFRAHQLLKTED